MTLVAEMINQLDVIEDDTDTLQIQLRQQLMSIEDQYSPVDVMFLYKILEWIGGIADQAQRVGSRLEIMLSRYLNKENVTKTRFYNGNPG